MTQGRGTGRRRLRAGLAPATLAALVLVLGAGLTGCQQDAGPAQRLTPSPLPEDTATGLATTGTTPSSGSSTSPDDVAAKAAQKALIAYYGATDAVARDGGATTLPDDLDALVAGPARDASLQTAQDLYNGGLDATGSSKVTDVQVLDVRRQADPPTVLLSACVDQSKLKLTRNGAPYTDRPNYVLINQAELRQRRGNWRVYDLKTQELTSGTCASR